MAYSTAEERAELDEKIARTKVLVTAHEDAIEALVVGGAQTYTLDTGQTRQSVTRAQLGSLRNALAYFENRLSVLKSRRCGSAIQGRPGF